MDQPKESQTPSNQSNFTCPLPPITCPSSPDQRPTMQQAQQGEDIENDSTLQSQTSGSGEENVLEDETTKNGIKKIPEVEKGVDGHEGTQGEVIEKGEEKKTGDEGERESIIPASTSDLHPSISTEERRENSSRCDLPTEATTSSPNPDLLHPIQRRQPPTRESHLTKRDKKIIEKIRSYYEAAAKAEEDETEEDVEEEEGVASRRRNSFSQIPSGLVKESVSRFDVGGHLGEPESEQTKYETTEANDRETEPYSISDPISSPAPLSADAENDGEADKPISSLDFSAEGQIFTVSQDKETPNQVGLNPNRPVEEEAEIQDRNGKVCRGPSEEGLEDKQEGKTSVVDTAQEDGSSITKQYKCRDETTNTGTRNQAGHEPSQVGPVEPNGSHKEPSRGPVPPTEQCQKPENKFQSSWTRNNHRDLAKASRNVDGLPSQIKVSQWSNHSRIVSANRALFEAMGSDVAGIGLFEASPVVDPVLMENSERILSKVQTLAQMYGAKASTMKVPLHQKRGSTARNPSWSTARLSGHSPQTEIKSQTQVQIQTPTEYQQQLQWQMKSNQSDTHAETKYGTRTHSEAKVQSQTITQTMQQLQIQTKSLIQTHYQIQNQTKIYSPSQIQAMSREDETIQEKKMIKRAESLTNGRLFNGSGFLGDSAIWASG